MTRNPHRLARTFASSALTAIALHSATAEAHFRLDSPASATIQNTQGDPQKTGPCGGSMATNMVTPFAPGDAITIKLTETVPHPGHYRVALASSRDQLPADPVVTGAQCGSAAIAATPAYPVLVDGVLKNDANGTTGAKEIQVTLPTNVTCDKCTLQVIQFMSKHGAPCFYYHCADISIKGASGTGGSGGGQSAGSGGASAGLGGGGSSGSSGSSGAATGGASGGISGGATSGGTSGAPAGGAAGSGGSLSAGSSSVAGSLGAGGSPGASGAPAVVAGAAGASPSAGAAGASTSVALDEGDDGGCAFGARGAGSASVGALVLGALAALARVRRRRSVSAPGRAKY